ncbi:HNH endonuclease [Stutzerimonas kunmingensis]
MIPTQQDIRATFNYRDGGLYRISTGRRGYRRPDGYVYSRLNGREYGEHRLVHLLFTGQWPEQVDHANGVRWDNRPDNLRPASHAQNCMNRKPMGRSSKGCYWQSKRRKWIAQIGVNGRRVTIGYFDTEDEAAAAYAAKSAELHKEYGRTH